MSNCSAVGFRRFSSLRTTHVKDPARNSMMKKTRSGGCTRADVLCCLCADERRSSPQEQIVSQCKARHVEHFRVSMASWRVPHPRTSSQHTRSPRSLVRAEPQQDSWDDGSVFRDGSASLVRWSGSAGMKIETLVSFLLKLGPVSPGPTTSTRSGAEPGRLGQLGGM